jgi:hypothetical protein
MKRMLILAVTLWLGVSATAHAQVNSPTNTASTVTGAIVLSGQGVTLATGGGFSPFLPVLVPCPFGVSLSAILTAFGCASDPRPHLSDFGGSRGCDNGTSRQHQRQRANRQAQRHIGRWWCWRRCLIERGLLGRDTVNGRQRRRRRSLRRNRRMLARSHKSDSVSHSTDVCFAPDNGLK